MEPSWYVVIAWFVISGWALLSAHGLYEIWKSNSWYRPPTQSELMRLGIAPEDYVGKMMGSADSASRAMQNQQRIASSSVGIFSTLPDDDSSEIAQEAGTIRNHAEPSWLKIISWALAVCLATGLASPLTSSSKTPTLLGWFAPETRSILLEDPIMELVSYLGFGLGGAIGPAILAYGIYWGIRHLIKPRTKINWSALLGLSIAFGAMSVLGSYSSTTASNDNSELHTPTQSTSSIESSLAALAAEMSSQVPIQVDHMTTVTGVAAIGSSLNLYHSIDLYIEPTQIGTTRADLLLQTGEQVCQKPEMAALIEAGVSIYYSYSDLGGNLIDFTIRECS